jgi:hypothetical protein
MVFLTALWAPAFAKQLPPAVVDVITDCGAVGDGTTQDGGTIQRCLDQHPGQIISFRKTQPLGSPDYYVNVTLTMKGLGQKIRCESSGGSENQVTLLFPSGVTGIIIDNNYAQFASVEGCSLHGGDPWSLTAQPVGASDGIRIYGHGARIANVGVLYFARHGIAIDTTNYVGNANNFFVERVRSMRNRGDGFYVSGGDSNAGVFIQDDATANQGWGFEEHSFLGNTYIAPHTSSNGAGPYKAITPAAINTFVGAYSEEDQQPSQINYRNLVIGGDHGASFDYSLAPFVMDTSVRGATMTPFTVADPLAVSDDTYPYAIKFGAGFNEGDGTLLTLWNGNTYLDRYLGLRRTGPDGWWGWRCCVNSDLNGFKNYALLMGDGRTTETSGGYYPKVWFPNGFYLESDTVSTSRVYVDASPAVPANPCTDQQIILNTAPTAGGVIGWTCVSGSWKGFGRIEN